jgi:hypothetical protein
VRKTGNEERNHSGNCSGKRSARCVDHHTSHCVGLGWVGEPSPSRCSCRGWLIAAGAGLAIGALSDDLERGRMLTAIVALPLAAIGLSFSTFSTLTLAPKPRFGENLGIPFLGAWVAKLVDAQDLKSWGSKDPYRFDSGPRHQKILQT